MPKTQTSAPKTKKLRIPTSRDVSDCESLMDKSQARSEKFRVKDAGLEG